MALKHIPLFAAAILFTALAAGQTQTPIKYKAIWEPVNYPEDLELLDVAFVNDQVGWAAGGVSVMRGGVILHTDDGGGSWKVQLGDPQSSDRAYRGLHFLDDKRGWAVQSTGQDARLLHTSDGENWQVTGSVPEHYIDYAFTSDRTGVLIDSREITRTQDGGKHWRTVASCVVKAVVNGLTKNVSCEFSALHFPSASVGYAVAYSYDVQDAFFIFKTTDGGSTWSGNSSPSEGGAQDVFFTGDKSGFLRAGAPDTGKLYQTSDGGQSWSGVAASAGNKLAFTGVDIGWVFHYKKLSYTTDGGKRWSSREFPFPVPVNAFALPSRQRAYAVGDHGMIYRYRIVPADYKAKGMIDAPMMPGARMPEGVTPK